MGFDQFRFWIEFSLLSVATGGLFFFGLLTGKTAMKAPFGASRSEEPAKYWMGQTFWGLWFLLCLCVSVHMTPSHFAVSIVWAY